MVVLRDKFLTFFFMGRKEWDVFKSLRHKLLGMEKVLIHFARFSSGLLLGVEGGILSSSCKFDVPVNV